METKPFNVAYIIDSLSFGGAERQLVELLKGVVRYRKSITPNLYLLQVGTKGYYQLVDELGVTICHIPRRRKYDITILPRLIVKLREQKIDIIHSFSVMAGLLAVISGRCLSLPVVASTIRDAQNRDYKTALSIRLQSFLADSFISNCHAGFDNRFKCYRDNFRVVYNGVDLQRFHSSATRRESARNYYQLDRFDDLVVMVASLSVNKDHRTLLRAVPGVLAERPRIGFVILGDGSEKESLQLMAQEMGIAENVLFAGFVDDIYAILEQSAIAVLLSNPEHHQEGIPNALLESMAMGLPVVATTGGGTPELVENGVNGILVPPLDNQAVVKALLMLLGNIDLRHKLGQEGRQTVSDKFNLTRYLNDYFDIYTKLLARK